MNFNKDIIRHVNGETISRVAKETKSVIGKIADELAPSTTRDISNGVAAEDAMGRAAFSMMNRIPQFKLQERLAKVCEGLET